MKGDDEPQPHNSATVEQSSDLKTSNTDSEPTTVLDEQQDDLTQSVEDQLNNDLLEQTRSEMDIVPSKEQTKSEMDITPSKEDQTVQESEGEDFVQSSESVSRTESPTADQVATNVSEHESRNDPLIGGSDSDDIKATRQSHEPQRKDEQLPEAAHDEL